jgi:hypothetical protein
MPLHIFSKNYFSESFNPQAIVKLLFCQAFYLPAEKSQLPAAHPHPFLPFKAGQALLFFSLSAT